MLASLIRRIRPSGILEIFELRSKLSGPLDLSIGPPDSEVQDAVERAAIRAIEGSIAGGFAPRELVATSSRARAG